MPRRVNAFAAFHNGVLLVESIRRGKLDTIQWAKAEQCRMFKDSDPGTWDELAAGAGLSLCRVQILILDSVQARHGNTGRKRK